MQWRELDRRPRGITIISILMILAGILYAIVGLVFFAIAGFLGLIYLALAAYALIVGYGLYVGKGWAWTTTVIAQIIGLAVGVISSVLISQDPVIGLTASIPGLIVGIIILWYMLRSTTRAYFGKVKLS